MFCLTASAICLTSSATCPKSSDTNLFSHLFVYCLTMSFSSRSIALTLPEGLPRVECLHCHTIGSTLTDFYAQAWQTAGVVPRLLVADYQTAGQGQRGNHWESAADKNLLFTLEIHPRRIAATAQFALSIIAAMAARASCVPEVDASKLVLKWPNDLYYEDRKLGGILIQHTLEGAQLCTTLVGVGINVNQTRFESDAPNPISLQQITQRVCDRWVVLERFVQTFLEHLSRLEQCADYAATLWQCYHNLLYRREGYHPYCAGGQMFNAQIAQVDSLGRLHLVHEDGTQQAYAFKEVAAIVPPSKA